MRYLFPLIAALMFAGCDSLAPVSSGGQAHRQAFASDIPTIYRASRLSLQRMRFEVTNGSISEGLIDAVGVDGSNQATIHVQVRQGIGGNPEVVAQMSEVALDGSGNPAASAKPVPVDESPLFATFFAGIQKNVDAAAGR